MNEAKMVREIAAQLRCIKPEIGDDCRAAEDDTIPGIAITLGMTGDDWDIQTGDNQFTGAAYGHRHWGTRSLHRRTNCTHLAQDLVDQCLDAAAS